MRQLISAMLRRWYVPVGSLLCAALFTVALANDGGIYSTKTVVSFLRPASTSLSPTNGTNDSNIIAFAAAIVQSVNNGRPAARYSMDDAPYYGAGIRQGVLVDLTNSGNQWAATFSKAEIEIQIVGRTLEWVQSQQRILVAKVVSTAESQQASVGIVPKDRISVSVVPLTTEIEYVSPAISSQLTAGAAMFGVALILAAWVAVRVDRRLLRRRLSPQRSNSRPRRSRSADPVVEGATA